VEKGGKDDPPRNVNHHSYVYIQNAKQHISERSEMAANARRCLRICTQCGRKCNMNFPFLGKKEKKYNHADSV